MAIYFVSDFHLGGDTAVVEKRKREMFESFLKRMEGDLQHLVILGDMFDFWFEYRHLIPKHNLHLLFLLGELVQAGAKVSYITGNHDHWVGDFLSGELGIDVVGDSLELDTDRGPILAMHGDGLAKSDWKYRVLKNILRNRVCIALYRLLPPALAYALAHRASRSSRRHTSKRPRDQVVADYRDYAINQLSGGYFAFICGHVHRPHLEQIDGKYFANAGDWISHFSFVRYDDGHFELGTMLTETSA
jgi:UDP-2,3-diacylglucosamine hydrolase